MAEERELQKMHLVKGDIIVWIIFITYKHNGEEI